MTAALPRSTPEDGSSTPPVIEVGAEEGRRLFDEWARAWLDMSGEAFIARWQAGEYAELVEPPDNRRIIDLILLIPFAQRDTEGREQ